MNRFIINLRSLDAPDASQGSSARRQSSRFSAPNFHVSDSFLGNIGEDLQDGHDPVDNDLGGYHTMDAVCPDTEGSLEAAMLEETSTTPGSSTSRLMDSTQVSLQIHSGSNRHERTPFHLG